VEMVARRGEQKCVGWSKVTTSSTKSMEGKVRRRRGNDTRGVTTPANTVQVDGVGSAAATRVL
jgi:hypothetical protein